LKVYDLAGQLLEKRTNFYNAGRHKLIITDQFLSSSGVYLYEIQVGEEIVQNKMILMK